MLPQETIANLSHRLDLITQRVYCDVEDTTTVNKTKFIKFLQINPTEMRTNILKNEINTYTKAVKRVEFIQDCIKSNQILNCNNEEGKLNNLTHQINSLQESVEKIQKSKQQNQNFKKR